MERQADYYARVWQLGEIDFVGETAHSRFYACTSGDGRALLLKILTGAGRSAERGGFAVLARYQSGDAVRVHIHDEGAALMDRLDGPSLLTLIDAGEEERALAIQLDLTGRLLANRQDSPRLKSLADIMAESLALSFDRVPDWAQNVVRKAQLLCRDYLRHRSGWQPLHGDLHPRNILQHQGRWLAIDARGILGPPAFEYANLFINPWDRKELIFADGRMAAIAGRVSDALRCDRRETMICAIANALWYANVQFPHGRGRHPVRCMRALLDLLDAEGASDGRGHEWV